MCVVRQLDLLIELMSKIKAKSAKDRINSEKLVLFTTLLLRKCGALEGSLRSLIDKKVVNHF